VRVCKREGGRENGPALLLVELVAHALAEFLEFAPGLCVVCVDDEILEMP
jgi:hypothetical protein